MSGAVCRSELRRRRGATPGARLGQSSYGYGRGRCVWALGRGLRYSTDAHRSALLRKTRVGVLRLSRSWRTLLRSISVDTAQPESHPCILLVCMKRWSGLLGWGSS